MRKTILMMAGIFALTLAADAARAEEGGGDCQLTCQAQCRQAAALCSTQAVLAMRGNKAGCINDMAGAVLECEALAAEGQGLCGGLCGEARKGCMAEVRAGAKTCKEDAKGAADACKRESEEGFAADKAACAAEGEACMAGCNVELQ
jgi:hypothetical protein